MQLKFPQSDQLIEKALSEDKVSDDVTSQSIIDGQWETTAAIVSKQCGVLCGTPLLHRLCDKYFTDLTLDTHLQDGAPLSDNTPIADLRGSAISLLGFERLALNFLQKLSGIAALTKKFVDSVSENKVAVLDTRKTTPGWRSLEKYAVTCGGGQNHRMDLKEQALIKENHLQIISDHLGLSTLESIEYALKNIKKISKNIPIEIEVETLPQLQTALKYEPDIVLLDNMTPLEISKAIECVNSACSSGIIRPDIEVSGGINIDNINDYAHLDIDRISIGALTHSAPALDIALNISDTSNQPLEQ